MALHLEWLTEFCHFSHALHHHLKLEVAPLWFIPNSTYIQAMCPRKRRSRMPCETYSLKRKDCQVRYQQPTQNQSELTIDAVPVFCLMSRISSDPLRIRTKQSRDSLGHKQTTPRLAHYIGNGWMTKGECIPSKSPTHTTSLNVSSDS